MIALPSAVKVFNWLGTIWGGKIQFTTPMLFALSFVSMFIIGGLSGIFMAATPVDIFIHDTYFIVAHFHYVLFAGTAMAVFGAIYFWFPKMFGRMMNENAGQDSLLPDVHLPQRHVLHDAHSGRGRLSAAAGRPVRLRDVPPPAADEPVHDASARSCMVAIAGDLRLQLHLQHVLRHAASAAIRGARTAWNGSAPSPPGHGNFDFQPIVYRGPYEYGSPEVDTDNYPQTQPPPEHAKPPVRRRHH